MPLFFCTSLVTIITFLDSPLNQLFLSQSETFKWSDLIRQFNFWTRQIKKKILIKWYIFAILQNICSFSRELY